ncbi:MAG: hypothetical protein E7381_06075 [Clostridiales bacterium]|nr:hypothetical protein [Clostridiales bacterium]
MYKTIRSGDWGGKYGHCQGFAVDTQRKYVYYSFTTRLIKADMNGNMVGSVENIFGHLGCMDFCDIDGKVYASLEYKKDSIGQGILQKMGIDPNAISEGFFIAIFDVDKIDRLNMDAEKDGVMKVVRLRTVENDYKGTSISNGKELAHVHGCSGIDGLTIGTEFGCDKNSRKFLHVCYGIYGDTERKDNDYQVILQYDFEDWWKNASSISQVSFDKLYEEKAPRNQYFLYTGNTTFGIQNLEYDEYTGDYFATVYPGTKPQFTNYTMFYIDGSKKAEWKPLKGKNMEGLEISLRNAGKNKSGATGSFFPHGSMGTYSLGDGCFYFIQASFPGDETRSAVDAVAYRLVETDDEWRFEPVNE